MVLNYLRGEKWTKWKEPLKMHTTVSSKEVKDILWGEVFKQKCELNKCRQNSAEAGHWRTGRWAQPLMAWSPSRGPGAQRTDRGDELQRKQKHSFVLPLCPSLGATTITSSTRLISRKCPFVISSQSFRFQSYIDVFSPFPVGLHMLDWLPSHC